MGPPLPQYRRPSVLGSAGGIALLFFILRDVFIVCRVGAKDLPRAGQHAQLQSSDVVVSFYYPQYAYWRLHITIVRQEMKSMFLSPQISSKTAASHISHCPRPKIQASGSVGIPMRRNISQLAAANDRSDDRCIAIQL